VRVPVIAQDMLVHRTDVPGGAVGRGRPRCIVERSEQPERALQLVRLEAHRLVMRQRFDGHDVDRRDGHDRAPLVRAAGDTLVFWKSDRWGRSAAHVLTTISELRDRGVTVKSLTENFDLDTKEGRFMFAVLAAAGYELELRAERQAEGIAAARRRQAEGRMLPGKKHIGRPKVTGPAEIAALRRLVGDGASVTQAARTLKISRSTAYAALATTR